jgi:hypothetical protein
MSDLAGAYLRGLQVGQGLTSDLISGGVEAYQKAKSYKDAVQERAEGKKAAADAAILDRAFDERKQREVERHNKAVEGEWKPGSRGGSTRGGGAGMSPEQRLSVARRGVMKQYMDADAKGEPITAELESAYQDAVKGEHDYISGGNPTPAAKSGDEKPKEKTPWADALHTAVDFFRDKPAPAAPQKYLHTKARLPDGRIVTRNPDGSWPK